jgi:16S rRNA (cytidine1402-2'-O)-methyltransferase
MALIFVPTPLGNLGDVTLRSIQALRDADLIVAEDTRVARKLLNALEIGPKELWSYREQNAPAVTGGILARAREQRVAVVTDAGMPAISDPGGDLIAAARAAGVAVEVLPGPSALVGAAVLSGFPLRRFSFEGFPARASSARRAEFSAALRTGMTTVWYESPQRILAALADLDAIAPNARVFVLREYTKRFEQQISGTPASAAAALEVPVRGEIAFVIAPEEMPALPAEPRELDAAIDARLDAGQHARDIARALAAEGAGDRRALYTKISERKAGRGMGRKPAAEDPPS